MDQTLEGISGKPDTPVKNLDEESKKVDSGMDEGSNSSQDLGELSEDEEVVSLRPKKTVHRILDDESEDSRDAGTEPQKSQKKELKTAEEALDEILNASSSSDDSDGEKVTLAASLKKKKIVKRTVSEDSSDDDHQTLLSTIKNNAKSTMSDIFDAEEDSNSLGHTENSSQQDSQTASVSQVSEEKDGNVSSKKREGELKKKKKKKKKKNNISPKKKTHESRFGTGADFKSKEFISSSDSSDSDEDKPPKASDSSDDDIGSSSGSESDESEKDNKSDGDEGFDESTISPALLKKLKKGAAKKERPERKAKTIAQEEKMQIHSETQRMIRESRVCLPYHQPAPRSINDFLARATKKQQEYKLLKGTRDFTKAKLMQDLLQKTKLPAPTLSEKDHDSDEDWNPEDDHMKKLKDRLDEKLKGPKETIGNKAENDDEKQNSMVDEKSGTQTQNDIENGDDMVSDNDSLPDVGDSDIHKVKERLIPVQGGDEGARKTDDNETLNDSMDTDECVSQIENVMRNNEKTENIITKDHSDVSDTKGREADLVENSKRAENQQNVDSGISIEHEKDNNSASQNVQICAENEDSGNKDSSLSQDRAESLDVHAEKEDRENEDPNQSQDHAKQHDLESPVKSETKDIKVLSEKKRSKLAALASVDLNTIKPCLSGNSDTFICLEEEEKVPTHPGVAKLMDRLCKHSTKKEKKHATDVDISIIQKDKAGLDREELKLNTFTYHTEEEKENPLLKLETPGAKLMALKEQLQAKMKEKREIARQHRQDLFDLDNEEGGFDVEEEEAEMSDRSDTDVEDEEDNDEEEEMEEEEGIEEEEERETNPFADEEAAEDDDGLENSDDDGDNVLDDDDDDEMNLRLDVSDEESERKVRKDDDDSNEDSKPSKKPLKKKKKTSVHVSEEETADTDDLSEQKDEEIPTSSEFKEPVEKPFGMFGSRSTSKESILPDTQLQSGQRSFQLSFPEESQDLYGNNTMPELGPTQFKQTQESQKLNFFLEDSQSNMLDADGYLRVKSTAKKPSKLAVLDEIPESQDQMDDLLGLCSGKFTGTQQPKDKTSRKSLFEEQEVQDGQGNMDELMGLCSGVFTKTSQLESQKKELKSKALLDEKEIQDTQSNMDELMGLCSGVFSKTSQMESQKKGLKSKALLDEKEVQNTQSNMDELMDLCSGVFTKGSQKESQKKGLKRKVSEDEGEEDSLEAFSDDEKNPAKDGFSDDDGDAEENNDTDQVDDEDEGEKDDEDEKEERPRKFKGFTVQNKHGKIRPEFVEAEAELSGSEVDSDEDLDLAEDDDIMEIEEGDKDDIANNDQLRDEVGRVHLKQLIDEDKRELMRFQEMYLPDGDLYSEGNGRMRRFRWNNNDDDTQQDMFDNDSEGELVEEETDTDFMWRKERFEREQFLQEQQEKESEETENSQFMKLGKIFLKKQGSVDRTVVSEKPTSAKTMAQGKDSPSVGLYKLSNQKRGSFLARSKEALAKIAEMTKPVANPSAGAKSSGKFTFAVISPDKDTSKQPEKGDKPKRQARTDTSKNKVTIGNKPPAKKQKLDTENSFTEKSIFHHL